MQVRSIVDKQLWVRGIGHRELPARLVMLCSTGVDQRAGLEGEAGEGQDRIAGALHGPSLEDADSHWGSCLSMRNEVGSSCPACGLPLFMPTADSAERAERAREGTGSSAVSVEVIVFRCQHAFHRCCVAQLACLQCFERNFTLFGNGT